MPSDRLADSLPAVAEVDGAGLGVDLDAVRARVDLYVRHRNEVFARAALVLDPAVLRTLDRGLRRLPAAGAVAFLSVLDGATPRTLTAVRARLAAAVDPRWAPSLALVDALQRAHQAADGAFVPGAAVAPVLGAAVVGVRALRPRDGGLAESPALRQGLDVLAAAERRRVAGLSGVAMIGQAERAPETLSMSVAEYAARTGWSDRTIRRRLTVGTLPGRQQAGGNWIVFVPREPDGPHQPDPGGQ
ncbi:hypothetical protein [Frankia sp. CcI49]|uniref:hypothetical protein n=1 Tax=Frankia sp. CcI49 TaxID=1745382 RepID=UPI0010546BEF|nr:hypothetical protein [Frankia sp. CcI49]